MCPYCTRRASQTEAGPANLIARRPRCPLNRSAIERAAFDTHSPRPIIICILGPHLPNLVYPPIKVSLMKTEDSTHLPGVSDVWRTPFAVRQVDVPSGSL